MILKYLFNLRCSFELMDTRIIQSSTGEKVSINSSGGGKSSPPSINLPQTFISVFTLIPGLASLYGSRETNKQTHTSLLHNTEGSKARPTTCILGIVPCSGEMFLSQDLFTLLQQQQLGGVNKGRE